MPTLGQTSECFYATNYLRKTASDLAPTMPTMLFKAAECQSGGIRAAIAIEIWARSGRYENPPCHFCNSHQQGLAVFYGGGDGAASLASGVFARQQFVTVAGHQPSFQGGSGGPFQHLPGHHE